ncbi:MAG: efflux RND transporter periplasmic adaptor subunit [Bacteriovoracaceae bacterium]|nr:efflux RND transporter periplasmic adaptor subunit [Bacteriovoracaceae bacterium]
MSKKKIILIILVVIAVILAGLTAKFSPSYFNFFGSKESSAIVIQGESFVFEVSITPDPPKEKGNTLIIKVKDSKGIPVEKADIEIAYETAAMTGMPSIKKSAKVKEASKGIYETNLDLPNKEMWTLNITVSTPQGTGWGRFSLSVGQKGLTKVAEKTGKGQAAIKEETNANEVVIEPQRRQIIGVRTGLVTKGPMSLVIRAFGNISYNETELNDVTLRIRGWVTNLKVNYLGEYVKKGQVLFTLYSPELYAAQKEYVQILKRESKKSTEAFDRTNSILKAAKERLKLWGVSDEQIDEITNRQEAIEKMPFLSPADGYVIEKNVVEGDLIEAGLKIFRIAPIEKVWLKAEIYQSDLLQIKRGDKAEISLPYIPGKTYTAHAAYIYPYLQGNARTGQVLFQLDNPVQDLLPDMYANIEININVGERLQVPESAVIYIGNGHVVFLDLGEGRLNPKKVKVGLRSNGYFEVLSGLKQGDQVVISGNFLIAAESRLLSAMKYWGVEDESDQGK